MELMILYITIAISILCVLLSLKKTDKSIDFLDIKSTGSFRGLAIIAIVFIHLLQNIGAPNWFLNIFLYCGCITVGIFFFISGYANYQSLRKKDNVKGKWLYKKVFRLYLTFLFAYLINAILLAVVNKEAFDIQTVLLELLSIKLHLWIIWYLKVQIAAYIILWVSLKLFKMHNLKILWGISLLYCIVFILLKFNDFWWNSILCFPLGVTIAKYKENITVFLKKINIFVALAPAFILSVITYKIYMTGNNEIFGLISSILFCIFTVSFVFHFKIHSKILNFIGNISLEIYIWHLVFIDLYFKNALFIKNMNIMILIFFTSIIIFALATKKLINVIMNFVFKVNKSIEIPFLKK